MKRLELKMLKYIPIILFASVFIFDMVTIYFIDFKPCSCVTQYNFQFMFNELCWLGFISFMYFTAKRSRLCYYNKLSIVGLLILTLLNIIAISTPFNFSIYSSVITQISISAILMSSIYFLIKKI